MGYAEGAPSEGAVITQVALAYDEQVFASGVTDSLEDEEIAFEHGLTLLAVAIAALALGLLPVVVGVAILLGWTVPLGFGAGAGLTILAGFKVGAGALGMVAATRAPGPAVPASGIHL